jgi:hypothetical protein
VLLGIHLTLLIGPTVPVPAPAELTEALVSAEVTHTDEGRSGFQLTFQAGRSGPSDIVDYPLLLNPLLRTFNRVILIVTFNAVPRVLSDGFITRQQLTPSNEPGASTLTVSGEDVSVMMDLVEEKTMHPAQDETTIVAPPIVIPPPQIDFPPPTEHLPTQPAMTDLRHITELAGRFGHVFFVTPGLLPGQNIAYWGPPPRADVPQPAISVNVGPSTNAEQINFQYDAMAPTTIVDVVQVSDFDIPMPVVMPVSTRLPPLAAFPSPLFNLPNVRVSTLGTQEPPSGTAEPHGRGGMTWLQAFALAAAKVNTSVDKVVTATGELDALRYGEILMPRTLVGVRGSGFTNDGSYYVKSVTHSITRGSYRQRFTLTREGVGALTPVVRP